MKVEARQLWIKLTSRLWQTNRPVTGL